MLETSLNNYDSNSGKVIVRYQWTLDITIFCYHVINPPKWRRPFLQRCELIIGRVLKKSISSFLEITFSGKYFFLKSHNLKYHKFSGTSPINLPLQTASKPNGYIGILFCKFFSYKFFINNIQTKHKINNWSTRCWLP